MTPRDPDTESADLPGSTRVLHPFLLAAWPVLALYSSNIQELLLSDVLLPLSIVLLAAVLLYFLLLLILRNRFKAGLIVTTLALFIFSYQLIYEAAHQANEYFGIEFIMRLEAAIRHRYVLAPLLLLAGGASLYFALTRRDLVRPTRLLNVVAVCLVAIAVGSVIIGKTTLWLTASPTQLALAEANQSTTNVLSEDSSRPDIYYIIFDRYGDRETLQTAYNFDNTPFYDSLRSKGFFVAEQSRCNYPNSSLSLCASLNLRYHPDEIRGYDVARSLRSGHEVGRLLKSLGYTYIHLGSYYSPTKTCALADENLGHATAMSEFNMVLLKMTPLPILFHSLNDAYGGNQAAIATYQFELLQELSKSVGQKFVFAHIILPHPPFVFTKEGTLRNEPLPEGSKKGYIEQLQYTNSKVEQVVDAILDNSKEPPVIILQADEGPYLREDDGDKSATDRRKIRSGILNAFYIPDKKMAGRLYPSISSINTFRVVLGAVGQEYELLEDRSYVWGDGDEYNQERVGLTRRFLFKDITESLRR